jgi:hypothetical protein
MRIAVIWLNCDDGWFCGDQAGFAKLPDDPGLKLVLFERATVANKIGGARKRLAADAIDAFSGFEMRLELRVAPPGFEFLDEVGGTCSRRKEAWAEICEALASRNKRRPYREENRACRSRCGERACAVRRTRE